MPAAGAPPMPAPPPPPAGANGALKTDTLEVKTDPAAEWAQMYRDAWRIQREFFYDANLHGVNVADFSKKYENHCHSISLFMFHFNFVRIHQTIRCTPAMAAGVTDQLWSMSDLVALIESRECEAVESPKAIWS